jgi:hypothetical protein
LSGESKSNATATILLGVLMSLIVKSAFDHAFAGVSKLETSTALWNALTNQPGRQFLRLCRLGVFVFTLIRFYLGAQRYAAECPANSELPQAVTTVIGTTLLFAGFYVASLALPEPDVFYWIVIIFHVLDALWFVVAGIVLDLPSDLQTLVGAWKVFDVLTIVGLLAVRCVRSSTVAEVLSLGILLSIGGADLYSFRAFYLNKDDWKNRRFTWPCKKKEPVAQVVTTNDLKDKK